MNAVRASDGKLVWQTPDLGLGIAGSGRFYSTAAVAFGRVYAGDVDNRVYSYDADDRRDRLDVLGRRLRLLGHRRGGHEGHRPDRLLRLPRPQRLRASTRRRAR